MQCCVQANLIRPSVRTGAPSPLKRGRLEFTGICSIILYSEGSMRRESSLMKYALFALALIAIIAFTFQKASASGELSAKVQQWLVSTLTAKGV